MSSTFVIQLHHLRFAAAHGVFEEEARVGNEFEVNISLTVTAPEKIVMSIEDTINYAEVYRIVKELFAERKALLETLAMEIAEELKQQFPTLRKASVQISKLHPPITAFIGSVSVTYTKDFEG
jgi:7,8-dihydroneopterin aldolase/epimerase/oxygenase